MRCRASSANRCLTSLAIQRLSEILLSSPESSGRHLSERVPYISGMVMPHLKLHIFISRHEYESCRAVLMRNLYPVYVYRQPCPSGKSSAGNTPTNQPVLHPPLAHSELHWNNRTGVAGGMDASSRQNAAYTSNPPPQRFSAVQHLIAHLREVPQMNMWSIGQPQISVANRPVLMHMFYPQESYIPVTVNPLLRPIHLMSHFSSGAGGGGGGLNNQSSTSRTPQ